ncbi:MAG: RluA family pseudouridine synthase [gamma proteobacterium endosymbiont of Trioza apicalis]
MLKKNKKQNTIILYDKKNDQRIDNFLFNKYKKMSKNMIYSFIRKGVILINKKKIKPKYKLKYLDKISINFININKYLLIPKLIKLNKKLLSNISILYEDKYLLVLNKPAGIAVHGGSNLNYGIIELLRTTRPNSKFLELIHRLDKDTSGVLLIAKNHFTLCFLHNQFRLNKIKKIYLALIKGKFLFKKKVIIAPIGKSKLINNTRIVKIDANGKLSETHFMIKKCFSLATLVYVKPITGRTHQIRIHAKYMGHPIVLDNKYGDYKFNFKFEKLGIKRLFLHAKIICFKHPYYNKYINIRAPLDIFLDKCLNYLKKNYIL